MLNKSRIVSLILSFAMIFSMLTILGTGVSAATDGIIEAGGWFESAYAKWAPVSGADGYNAYYSAGSEWTKIDGELIRTYKDFLRVDAVGLTAGSYKIKIVPTVGGAEKSELALESDIIPVMPYDRSGYAHFGYDKGVGAYNDDGTLKKGAIVLYVTEENKDSVTIKAKDGTTVTGIGNILNSVGQDVGGGKSSKGGKANTNSDILRKLAREGTPLVVRIVGRVTAPKGLTAYNSLDFGGSVGDNGFMARMSGGKDITIEGVGSDAVMDGWGLHFICQTGDYREGIGKSFEVRNIAFQNVPEDCVGMEGQQEGSTLTAPVERCWIHHCTFYAPTIANPAESDKDGGDGACDFKRGQYFTNSYCYYNGYHKTNLVGSSDSSLQYNITYHHNYWKDCESRGPLARQANIHMYNNIFEGQTSYCMSLRADSYIYSEYNMFLKCKKVVDDKTGGVCKSYNNSFASSSFGKGSIVYVNDKSETVSSGNKYANFDTNSALSYIPSGDYLLEDSIAEMKATVLAYAGNQRNNIVTPDEISGSVVPADRYPKTAVALDYSKSLNSTTVPSTSGTYDNIIFNVKKVASDGITIGGSTNDCDIVFFVNTEVNITMTAIDGTYLPVLCNAVGEEIITGSGSAKNLPSGVYFIQSSGYDVGSSKYKEAKIAALSIYAVDPNAAVNPLPPIPDEPELPDEPEIPEIPDNPGTDNPGTDNPGTDNPGNLPEEGYTHSFTENGKTDPEGFFTISGNTSSSKGTVSYNGLTLEVCLKIESSTNISFNTPVGGKLVLVFGGSTNAGGKAIKVDGTSRDIDSSQILVLSLEAGSHRITKDDSINLFYMAFYPEISHTHSYSEDITTAPTCTETGAATYTCSCGDSYEKTLEATGHRFRDGECLGCGMADPDLPKDEPTDKPNEPGDAACDCWVDADGDAICDECGAGGLIPPDIHNCVSFVGGFCPECGAPEPTEKPEENPEDKPIDKPEEPTETPDNTPEGPGNPENPGDTQPEEKLNFFQRIWKAIADFFRRLFGKKD